MNTKYTCPCCFKEYKLKCYYDRHILACSLLSKSANERAAEDELLQDLPTQKQLYELLLIYIKKTDKLENEVKFLKNSIKSPEKKIDIIDWLNNNYSDIDNFDYSIITISKSQFEFLHENSYFNTISSILTNNFNKNNNLPIKAFNLKDNTLFIKNDKWVIMTNKDFENIILDISKKLMNHFVHWQTINKNKLQDEKFCDLYTRVLQKIIGNESICFNAKLKKILFNHLKINLSKLQLK